jgi:cytochrome bd-type quinol oxidase subunit 2
MIQKLKRLMVTYVSSIMFLVPMAVPATVAAQADIGNNLCSGGNLAVNAPEGCTPEDTEEPINTIITTVINMFSLVVGIISVIMIIIGGLKYIMSGGEGANITGAKNTILYAIIGLVIVALAQVLVKFVLGRATPGTE